MVDLREIRWGDLTEDRDQWRALVNTVMNLRVPFMNKIMIVLVP
jgi:hypothetical protein